MFSLNDFNKVINKFAFAWLWIDNCNLQGSSDPIYLSYRSLEMSTGLIRGTSFLKRKLIKKIISKKNLIEKNISCCQSHVLSCCHPAHRYPLVRTARAWRHPVSGYAFPDLAFDIITPGLGFWTFCVRTDLEQPVLEFDQLVTWTWSSYRNCYGMICAERCYCVSKLGMKFGSLKII